MTPCPQCGSPADLGLQRVYCTNRACVHADKAPDAGGAMPRPELHEMRLVRVRAFGSTYTAWTRSLYNAAPGVSAFLWAEPRDDARNNYITDRHAFFGQDECLRAELQQPLAPQGSLGAGVPCTYEA